MYFRNARFPAEKTIQPEILVESENKFVEKHYCSKSKQKTFSLE